MKIQVQKNKPDEYVLTFDDGQITLDDADCKRLLLQLSEALSVQGVRRKINGPELLKLINGADDRSLQAFLREAREKDVVVLLKYAQPHEKFRQRLYANMSANRARLCREDLTYHFGDKELSKDLLRDTLPRLVDLADKMQRDGKLTLRTALAKGTPRRGQGK